MNKNEQAAALEKELQAVINRFRHEFQINYSIAIGCLEIVKLGLFKEAADE